MKEVITLLLLVAIQVFGQAQAKTKQVLIEASGQPIVLLHGGTFNYTAFAAHSKLLMTEDIWILFGCLQGHSSQRKLNTGV